MNKIYCISVFVILLFATCNQADKKKNSLPGMNNLPTQVFNIDLTHDTMLVTLNGARISIPAGSLYNAESRMAQLEIKEA